MRLLNRNFAPLIAFALIASIALFAALCGLLFESAAQNRIENNVATQGRALAPAGTLIVDATSNSPAIAPLTVDFVRSPDNAGADGAGRFLIAVNSGFGAQFNSKSKPQQTLSIIDLNRQPEPQVIQNIYFPSPNSANFGVAFAREKDADNAFTMFVAGGFENRIWIFKFNPNDAQPVSPANQPDAELKAGFIDVSGFTEFAPSPYYNRNQAPVYPTGIAVSPDDTSIFVANNLSDNLGVLEDWKGARRITKINLQPRNSKQFLYPYDVELLPASDNKVAKVYVSLWGDGSIAALDPANPAQTLKHVKVGRHPTAMILNRAKSKLFVVNSDADSVSVIDTATDQVVETINVCLAERALNGMSPEGLALSFDEKTLFVANARANAVAVVALAERVESLRVVSRESEDKSSKTPLTLDSRLSDSRLSDSRLPDSRLLGFIPTGNYPSAVAAIGDQLFVGNGKGTGVENSSVIVNNSGRAPNLPNEKFPAGKSNKRGAYNPALTLGNISRVELPNERRLYEYTQNVMRSNNLLGAKNTQLFANNRSPFKHVIYVIRENRTYDQVFGDLKTAGDGTKADGDASVAIFGAGEAAKSPGGKAQNITPNARALALRFGLLDRFFVNAEASPDGHNWSTAAFSNDYVDKAFRWNYSARGRTYDFEGFNRLPSFEPPANQPPSSVPSVFKLPASENDIADYLRLFVPYLNGGRDVGEPETLYLWDAAARAGLTYRNYGEFVATVSEADVREVNTREAKTYPDLSPTKTAFATKKSLENHFSPGARNYDLHTPDAMTTDSYLAAKADKRVDAAVLNDHKDQRFRGSSRFGEWLAEFQGFVADLNAGKGDRLPNLSILRLSNDHTAGLNEKMPTPQFFVAENDYALGRVVEAVSSSPYWRDTAIFVVEDDAQDGPDHVDAHRSPAFVISAYNRKGALVHDFHSTVSLIRTIELCLGIAPMNFLDANAAPINIFTDKPDFAPFKAVLPDVAADNLLPPAKQTAAMREMIELTEEQNLERADMANPRELNRIIWFSVRGAKSEMPEIASLPAFELLRAGIRADDDDEHEADDDDDD